MRVKIVAHQKADQQYMEYGIRIIELVQNAYSYYSKRSPQEKRKLLNFVLSNCVLQEGELSLPTGNPLIILHLRPP